MAKQNLGRVCMIARGAYDATVQYEPLDVVTYNHDSYVVKQTCTGITPVEGDYYYRMTDASPSIEAADAATANANAAATSTREALEEIRTVVDDGTDAPPIVCAASGEVISLTDSAQRLLQGLKVYGRTEQVKTTGKNLLSNTANTRTINGVTFTVNKDDGSVTVNGTASNDAYFYIHTSFETAIPTGQYRLTGCPNGGSSANYLLCDSYSGLAVDNGTGGNFTSDGNRKIDIAICIRLGVTCNNLVFKPMVSTDLTATYDDYEPYTDGIASPSPDYPQSLNSVGDGGSVTVTAAGKNSVKPIIKTTTQDGLTVTVDDDGIITANGTLTKNTAFKIGRYSLPVNCRLRMYAENVPNTSSPAYATTKDNGGAYVYALKSYGWISDVFRGSATTSQVSIVFTPATYTNFNARVIVAVDTDAWESYKAPTTATVTPMDGDGNALYLPGIKVDSGGNYTDSAGQQWVCDYIDFARGKYVQNVGKIILDGTKTMNMETPSSTGIPQFYIGFSSLSLPNPSTSHRQIFCNYAPNVTASYNCAYISSTHFFMRLPESMVSTSAAELAALQAETPTVALYILATPIEHDLVVKKYRECEGAGISREMYLDFYEFYQDSGIEGVTNSKVNDCMPYINQLSLTSTQKTALALTIWSEKTVNKNKLW